MAEDPCTSAAKQVLCYGGKPARPDENPAIGAHDLTEWGQNPKLGSRDINVLFLPYIQY